MLKPPSQNVPGMTDTLEFVKNLWGGMAVPGSGMPGIGAPQTSLEDLDKRIKDLKTVETWLNMNLSMLRSSIQALEVQRGTITALKTMTDSMTQAMGKMGDQTASLPPFAAFFAPGGMPQPGTGTAAAGGEQAAAPGGAPQAGGDGAGPDAAMAPALAWWNLLQEQFRQAVASAIPADGAASAPADGATPAGTAGAAGAADDGAAKAARASSGGDTGGTPGTASPKPPRSKSDKA